jgi:hypothetical protein
MPRLPQLVSPVELRGAPAPAPGIKQDEEPVPAAVTGAFPVSRP